MAKYIPFDADTFDATAGVVDATPAKPGVVAAIKAVFADFARRSYLKEARRNDARIARYIESHGGRLTDDLERQISREFGRQAGERR